MTLDDRTLEKIIKDEIEVDQSIEVVTNRKNILVVEGKTDREILERIAYHMHITLNFDIIEMKGVSNFDKIHDALETQVILEVRYITDNDKSARRWINKFDILDESNILTNKIYCFVPSRIKEMEEYVTNTSHDKNRSVKRRLLQNIWNWKDICEKNVNHLIRVIDDAFDGNGFIETTSSNL